MLRYVGPKDRAKARQGLPPVRPNKGIQIAYARKMDRLIEEMQESVLYWLRSAYRNNKPRMAEDANPADALARAIAKLRRRWLKRFDEGAESMAEWFAKSARNRSDRAMAGILRKAGFSVKFQMTAGMKDVLAATVHENVSLIKSIPEQYFKNVEGAVMRSVQAGRDLSELTRDLEKNYGVTRRRAAFIALDQNNKATGALNKVRQDDLGIEKARWRHSRGGKTPRPTHVANDGKLYDVKKGWYDPAVRRWIYPGELPNCRCVSVSVIPGFE